MQGTPNPTLGEIFHYNALDNCSTPAPYKYVPLEQLQLILSKPHQAHNFLF